MIQCPFCFLRQPYRIIYSDEVVTAFLAKDAVAPGQSLVIPSRHVASISDMTSLEVRSVFSLAIALSDLLRHKFGYDGINIACNDGERAGQSVSHLHIHVIPRKSGDISDPKLWLNTALFNRLYRPSSAEYKLLARKMKRNLVFPSTTNEITVASNGQFAVGKRVHLGLNVRIFGGCEIGDDSIIEDNVTIGHPAPAEVARVVRSRGRKTLSHLRVTKTRIGRGAIIRSGTTIYSGVEIGPSFDCGHNSLIRENTTIGKNVYVLPGTQIHAGVVIGQNVRIYGFICNGSIIENGASVLGNLVHSYRKGGRGRKESAPIIEKGAIVGIGATVIGKVRIGAKAIVGANAVVSHDVPSNEVVTGVPARIRKARPSSF